MILDSYINPTILEWGVNVLAYVNPSNAPTSEGLDYTSRVNRIHYSSQDNRLQYASRNNRLHYEASE